MRESISITTIFQIFILFVLLFTAIMALTINNSNAFGVKDSIVNAIEALDGNYTDGADLNEEIVKVIQETSYRTSGKCPDGYDGFDRAGNRVTSNSSDAAVCISDVDVTGGLDKAFSDFAQNDFVDGKYYKVVLFFQLDIPVFKQIFNFKTVGETRIIYNTIDNLEGVPESSKYKGPEDYDNQGNLDSREPTKGDDSGVNPVRNPGVSSSGGGTTTEEPVEEEEEETPQLTCNTEGLNLDTKLAGVQGVTLGSGQNQGNYGLLFTEPELATQITRMTPGTVFTIQGTASGDDTKWYINYEGQCGWANGANLGIDLGGYAQKIGARVQMNITNNSSSIFKVYGQSISGVTGKKLYNGMQDNTLPTLRAKRASPKLRFCGDPNDLHRRLQPRASPGRETPAFHRHRRQRHVSAGADPQFPRLRDQRQRRERRLHHRRGARPGHHRVHGPRPAERGRGGHGDLLGGHPRRQPRAAGGGRPGHPHPGAQRAAGLCEPAVPPQRVRGGHPRQDHHHLHDHHHAGTGGPGPRGGHRRQAAPHRRLWQGRHRQLHRGGGLRVCRDLPAADPPHRGAFEH